MCAFTAANMLATLSQPQRHIGLAAQGFRSLQVSVALLCTSWVLIESRTWAFPYIMISPPFPKLLLNFLSLSKWLPCLAIQQESKRSTSVPAICCSIGWFKADRYVKECQRCFKIVLSSAANAASAQNGTFWLLSPWGHPEVTTELSAMLLPLA